MKKFITGIILSVLGIIGTIVLISIAALNPYRINSREGLLVSLEGNDILFPFMCFLMLGLSGIIIIIYEAYKKKG